MVMAVSLPLVIQQFISTFVSLLDNIMVGQVGTLAMSAVWEAVKYQEKSPKIAKLLKEFDEVLSLNVDKIEEKNEEIPEEILGMLEERKEARLNKDFAKSDEIRDKLKEKGYLVIDSKEGQKLEKIK